MFFKFGKNHIKKKKEITDLKKKRKKKKKKKRSDIPHGNPFSTNKSLNISI